MAEPEAAVVAGRLIHFLTEIGDLPEPARLQPGLVLHQAYTMHAVVIAGVEVSGEQAL